MTMPVFSGSTERIVPKLQKLEVLDKERKAAENKFNDLKLQQAILEEEIYLLMEAEGVQNVGLGTQTFYRRLDRYFSVNKDNKEAAHNWLKDVGYGDLFQETINARTLTAEMKTRIDEEGLPVPDELFNLKMARRIGIKKR